MSPVELVKGANLRMEDVVGQSLPPIVVVVETESQTGGVDPDVSVLAVGPDGLVRSNDDLIFYNQPSGIDGAVQLIETEAGTEDGISRDSIAIDLQELPDSIARIIIAASVDPDAAETFGQAESVRMWVSAASDRDCRLIEFGISGLMEERALIFGELYRHSDSWKLRAVGQGYSAGLADLVSEFGIEVDESDEQSGESESCDPPPVSEEAVHQDAAIDSVDDRGDTLLDEAAGGLGASTDPAPSKVAIQRRRRPARLSRDWRERPSPYGLVPGTDQFRRARLFPVVGMKTTAEKEGRATSVLLSVMEIVREFGRALTAKMDGPGGRIETFTEVRFTHAGKDIRPDGLIRVTRGQRVWNALVEIKTGKAELSVEQVETYLQLAKAKGFDAVVTISGELTPIADETPIDVDPRLRKAVPHYHLSWEEVIAEAALVFGRDAMDNRFGSRILEDFLWYAAEDQSGMARFDDMGRQWVKVREAVKNRTIGAKDAATTDICQRFDELTRHVALQLSVLTGQRVVAQPPPNRPDAVSRAKQLADSGELFSTLRIPGAAGVVVLNANLAREKIACSIRTTSPRSGRVTTKVNWIARQLTDAPDGLRLTAHHAGSRSESTSALLGAVRADLTELVPDAGRDIREFTVTYERSMGSKRAGTTNGFVSTMVELANDFYVEVVECLRSGRDS